MTKTSSNSVATLQLVFDLTSEQKEQKFQLFCVLITMEIRTYIGKSCLIYLW